MEAFLFSDSYTLSSSSKLGFKIDDLRFAFSLKNLKIFALEQNTSLLSIVFSLLNMRKREVYTRIIGGNIVFFFLVGVNIVFINAECGPPVPCLEI